MKHTRELFSERVFFRARLYHTYDYILPLIKTGRFYQSLSNDPISLHCARIEAQVRNTERYLQTRYLFCGAPKIRPMRRKVLSFSQRARYSRCILPHQLFLVFTVESSTHPPLQSHTTRPQMAPGPAWRSAECQRVFLARNWLFLKPAAASSRIPFKPPAWAHYWRMGLRGCVWRKWLFFSCKPR